MTAIEQQIEDLGVWAAGLELSASDPSTPYWLRTQDAERAKLIRERQFILAGQSRPAPLHRCHTSGCPNVVAGDDYCTRCAEEINGQPYPLANALSDMLKSWEHRLFWVAVIAVAVFAFSILLILL